MSKILDEFNSEIHCPICGITTEHNIQKVDEEDNGEYIGYYAACDVCSNILEFSPEDEVFNKENKERKCRICGCTWFNGCLGGCYWVEEDLCSKCAI